MLQSISRFRGEIMGFATLWVVLFHFHSLYPGILDQISCIGYGGVDIFMFLSGFGLTVGYKKHSLLTFWRRRFVRIIPIFFICCFGWILLHHYPFSYLFEACIGYGYFVKGYQYWDWYVPTMYLFYLLFPLWMVLNNKKSLTYNFYSTIIAVFIGLLISLYFIFSHNHGILSATRVPTFFIGSFFGFLFINKITIDRKICLCLAVLSVLSIIFLLVIYRHYGMKPLWKLGLLWFPFIPAVPGLIYILSSVFSKLPAFSLKIFRFFGEISLEFFLIHKLYLEYLVIHYPYFSKDYPLLSLLILFIFVSIVSKIFHITTNYIIPR